MVQEDSRILVEPDIRPIRSPVTFLRAHDDRPRHFTLLQRAVRQHIVDGHYDEIADACIASFRAPKNTDALGPTGPRVVGHAQDRVFVDHQNRIFPA
jgi:hypothetical protein